MTASTPAGRIRAYLDAVPTRIMLGAELARGGQFRSDNWPYDAYQLSREDLEQVLADAAAHTDAPALRHCLYPTCLHEFDVAAWMGGKQPARPSWSGKGWQYVRPTVASGYVCPDHAPILAEHRHQWVERTDDGAVLTCSCGWTSPAARWPGYAAAAWQNHLLETGSADDDTKEA